MYENTEICTLQTYGWDEMRTKRWNLEWCNNTDSKSEDKRGFQRKFKQKKDVRSDLENDDLSHYIFSEVK